jgi:hypothetical protein
LLGLHKGAQQQQQQNRASGNPRLLAFTRRARIATAMQNPPCMPARPSVHHKVWLVGVPKKKNKKNKKTKKKKKKKKMQLAASQTRGRGRSFARCLAWLWRPAGPVRQQA